MSNSAMDMRILFSRKKKKKKRKAPLESVNDDTLAVSETNDLLYVDELKEEPNSIGLQEVTRKEKKKRKKKHTVQEEITDETSNLESYSNGYDNQVHEEKVTRKEKKKKKKHYMDGEEEASVKEEIEKETCDQRDDNHEMMVLEEELTKKSKKRKAIRESEKLVDSFESLSQIDGSNGGPDVKKKKVSWRENISESKDPEIFKDIEATHPPPVMNAILSLLSNVNNISDQEIPPNNSRKRSAKDKNDARLQKLAIKKERRKALRKSKIETGKLLQSKGQKSIEDCNIKNKKELTEKSEELVGSCEMKRPRLDERISSGPTRKRSRSITPDREVIPGHKWKDLTDQQKEIFNKKREQRRLDKLSVPKVILLNNGNLSSLRLEDEERTPLMLNDIQHFLMYSLHSHHTPGSIPSWVSLKFPSKISKVVCVIVDGVSMSDYLLQEDQLPALKSFQFQMEVITPYAYGGEFSKEFWTVPLSRTQRAKLIKKFGSLEKANLKGEAFESLKKLYPIDTFKTAEIVLQKTGIVNGIVKRTTKAFDQSLKDFIGIPDAFPRTELLLRSWDLLRESVPVPFATGYLAKKYEGFVRTKDRYLQVTDDSPIWAVDCEMCETCQGSELTRISVINEDFEVVYESLVKPHNPITNYLTQYSGITPELLENEWTRLEDVQNDLRNLLPADVILAGHSVGNDLLAMKMFHPYVIDTSVCFNFSGVRGRKTKLKTLVAELLYERIQDGGKDGHDSVEDAASCLKLLKAKLARYIEWGDAVLGGKRSEHESAIAQQQLLLRKEENKKKMVYPVAENAIIRSGPRMFKSIKEGKPSKTPTRVETVKPPAATVLPKPPAQDYSSLNKPEDTKQWSTSLFTNLFADGGKNLLVVGRGEFMKNGKELTNDKTKKAIRSDPRCVFAVQEDSKVLAYGCDNAPSNGISILRLDISMLKGKSKLEEVDAMIGKAVKNVKENVLFTVLLPGRFQPEEKHPNHGIFMMKIVRPPFVPLTIEDISQSTF
uniref:Exonuclease domain-containing protein n=2 Tax=Lygus hesperus TaxID=30085 RepID=A0A0K8S9A1_LYGHE